MSPRAAWRLEELGFERVYHFVGGKTEWIERGLPTEGTGPLLLLAGQVVRPATATCHIDTLAATVREELPPGPDSICAVVNEQGIVVGRVRWNDLPEDDNVRVESFMQPGPATVRPREELPPLLDRMRQAGVKTILVTTARGRLVGVVNRDDGERFVRDRAARSRSAEAVT
jgi:predicted transcriptional regulator